MKPAPTTCLVVVILPDRVGILHTVTGVICKRGGNLTDLRQNIMGGLFALNCIARFEEACDLENLRDEIRSAIAAPDAHVALIPCASEAASPPGPATGERHVAAVSGIDCPGWVHHVTGIFAAHGVNVEDWRHDLSDPARTLTFGAVRIPAGCDVATLQQELCTEMARHGMTASLLHENIFRATNEVGPIDALLADDNTGDTHA